MPDMFFWIWYLKFRKNPLKKPGKLYPTEQNIIVSAVNYPDPGSLSTSYIFHPVFVANLDPRHSLPTYRYIFP